MISYDSSDDADEGFAYTYSPRSEAGFRLPHQWLADGSALHDNLVGHGYHLLRLGGTDADTAPLEKSLRGLGAPLSVLQADEPHVRELYGADLVLLRPDLHIAWRGAAVPEDARALAELVTGHGTASTAPA